MTDEEQALLAAQLFVLEAVEQVDVLAQIPGEASGVRYLTYIDILL